MLFDYDDLLNIICDKYGGVIRNISGDQYFLTFSEIEMLFLAVQELYESWKRLMTHYRLGLAVAVHKGDLNIIRSSLYGNDINVAYVLEQINQSAHPAKVMRSVVVSRKVREDASGTNWESRFQEVDSSQIIDERLKTTITEHGAYWFVFEDDSDS